MINYEELYRQAMQLLREANTYIRKKNDEISKLIKDNPNDTDLGEVIRAIFTPEN